MTGVSVKPVKQASATPERRRYVLALGGLLAASLGLDYSIYIAGIAHVYVHEIASLAAGAIGVILALKKRSVFPASRGAWVALAFIGLLLLNTVVVGAIVYQAVPTAMHKLFWFEHGDAVRILLEIMAWVWVIGLLEPVTNETWTIFDVALWGGATAVVLDGGYWLLSRLIHLTTTPFDLTVMVGLPLSAVFVSRRGTRADAVRLGIYGVGSILLYSRAALIVVAITTGLIIVSDRRWRAMGTILGPIALGWIAVFGITLFVGIVPLTSNVARLGPPPGVTGTTISGSSPFGTLLRLLSLGDPQIAGYTIPSRERIWRDALSISKRDPLFGIGYHDYFAFSMVSEVKADSPPDTNGLSPNLIKAAHNDYLSMLAETGIVGLLFYLAFWALLLIAAFKFWRADRFETAWRAFTLGFLASLAGVGVFGEMLIPRSPQWLAPTLVYWIVISFLMIETDRHYGWLRWPRR